VKLAVVFPGQGSQRVGMGHDWLAQASAAATFAAADRALGFSLSRLCFEGPEEELKLTANQQPAILTVSWAIYQSIRDQLPEPAYFAGHSLGEYTALVAAGALEFEDAVATVHERGRLMQQTVRADLRQEVVVANLNSPEQIVVSGHAAAVQTAMERYQAAGAKRVVELPVSAPFHSPLMVPAADGLKPRLNGINFRPARVPVIANLTVEPYPAEAEQHPLLLHAQIFNPVRWTETVEYFRDHGVTHVLEVGPGKVLRLLTMKTARQLKAYNVDTTADAAGLADWLAAAADAGEGAQ
jgi:[acyl-carrier-protein] S-malonyltransferase